MAKGKFTTDRMKHSGEGIFFTSKMYDSFDILSGNLSFTETQQPTASQGTTVWMKIDDESTRRLTGVYDAFSVEGFGFDKTNVPIKLAGFARGKIGFTLTGKKSPRADRRVQGCCV